MTNPQSEISYFDDSKLTFTHLRMLLLCAFCYLFDQMDTNLFALAAPMLQETWGVTIEQIAQVNFYNYFGMFLGAVCGGWLADRLGRKPTLVLSIGLFSAGSLAGGLAMNFEFLAATRLFAGIGLISMVVVSMTYVTEMSPSKHRGKFISVILAISTLGNPIGSAIASQVIPLNEESWRIVFIIGGSVLFLLPVCLVWFKESPRWLISRGRNADAEVVVRYLTGRNVDLSRLSPIEQPKMGNAETLKVMFSREYLKRTIVLICITFSVTLGAHLLGGFYPTMLRENAGFALTISLNIMAISWWGMPLGNFTAAFVTDRGGRKLPLGFFQIINGIAFIVCGLIVNPFVIGIAQLLSRVFGGGAASMLYTYQAECYPTRIRSNAVGLISGTSRIIAAGSVLVVPLMLTSFGWMGIHIINAGIIVIPALILLIWGENTGGRSLEELNEKKES
jgi:putative MFS transporter